MTYADVLKEKAARAAATHGGVIEVEVVSSPPPPEVPEGFEDLL
jgi:hypothetical protein